MGGKAVKSILQSWFKNFTFPYPRTARNNHCSGKTTFCHCIVLFPEEQGAKWKEGRMQEEQYSPFLIGTLKAGAKLWMSSLTTLTIMHTTLDYPLSPLENVAAACMLLTVTANKPCLCFTHHVGCWFIPIHSWKCLFWLLKNNLTWPPMKQPVAGDQLKGASCLCMALLKPWLSFSLHQSEAAFWQNSLGLHRPTQFNALGLAICASCAGLCHLVPSGTEPYNLNFPAEFSLQLYWWCWTSWIQKEWTGFQRNVERVGQEETGTSLGKQQWYAFSNIKRSGATLVLYV